MAELLQIATPKPTTSTTTSTSNNSIEMAYAYAGVGSCGMAANLFILCVLFSDRKFLNQSALITGLAISHFLCSWAIGTTGIFRVINYDSLNDKTTILACMLRIYPASQPFAFQGMGAMLLLIGVERFAVFVFPNWYRVAWTNAHSWKLVGAGFAVVTCSWAIGLYIGSLQPAPTAFCGYISTFGRQYIAYSNAISACGGTVAVCLTLFGLQRGLRFSRKLPTASSEVSRYKRQLKLTRTMLTVSICDFCLVVIPNVVFVISVVFPDVAANVATGNFSNYTNVAYCVSTTMTLAPYLVFHRHFRAAALKLVTCKRAVHPKVTSSAIGAGPTTVEVRAVG